MKPDYDVVIVGAGLVGSSLALALAGTPATANLHIALVEGGQSPEVYSSTRFDPRVVALTLGSRNFLANLGLWSSLTRLCPFREMHVWDGEGTAQIHFDSAELHQPQLGHIVENSAILSVLEQKLTLCESLERIQPARVVDLEVLPYGGRQLHLDNGQTLSASLVVAADGSRSAVRELAGFRTREWDYGHTAIVTSVKCSEPHGFTAWQRFMRTGPLAFLPLLDAENDHWCSIVWSAETALAESLMALGDEDFRIRLGAAFEYRLGEVLEVAERFSIPLRQRHARDYVQPGIALVGDAAHNIHPLAGQGVNLGLRDVQALVCELSRASERGLPLADFSILRRYQRQRVGGNLAMMAAMEGFKQLFGSRSPALTWLRNLGMQGVNDLPALKNLIIKQVMG